MSRRIDSHEFYEVDKSGKEISFLFDGSVVWAREGDTISYVSYTHLTLPTKA